MIFLSTVFAQLLVDMHINCLSLDVPVVCGKKNFIERVVNPWNSLPPGALNLQGIEFARKGGGNCKEGNIQGKAPQ